MGAMPVATALTLAEAAQVLEPAMSEQQLRAIVTALGWQPDSWRRSGKPGRPSPAYDSADLMGLHAALVPFNRVELPNNRAQPARMRPC